MLEQHSDHVHTEHAVLDIGGDVGALIIYCPPEMRGRQIDVSSRGHEWQRTHTDVLERRINNSPVFAALFLSLVAGPYVIWGRNGETVGEVTITGGEVAQLDWRPQPSTFLIPTVDPQ